MITFAYEALSVIDWFDIGTATVETLIMVGTSLLFTVILGLPLGIVLFLTGPRQALAHARIYGVLSLLVNLIRSMPFVILLILLIPFTVSVIGTSIGVPGAIPPLVIGATPFFARLVENVLREVDKGVIEASQSMGASLSQTVFGAILPEAFPGLLGAITVTAIALVSYAAMSGVIGGGGLGDLAIRFGYQRFQSEIMCVTVAVLLALVQLLQFAGDRLVQHFTRS